MIASRRPRFPSCDASAALPPNRAPPVVADFLPAAGVSVTGPAERLLPWPPPLPEPAEPDMAPDELCPPQAVTSINSTADAVRAGRRRRLVGTLRGLASCVWWFMTTTRLGISGPE